MISFAYSEVKNFQYLSIIIAILGLILTFESSRLRAFKFSESDWVETKEDFYLEIKKIRHLKNLPTPQVFGQTKSGSLEEIGVAIHIDSDKTVKIYANSRLKQDVIVKI